MDRVVPALTRVINVFFGQQVVINQYFEPLGASTDRYPSIVQRQNHLDLEWVLFLFLELGIDSTLIILIVDVTKAAQAEQSAVTHRYIGGHQSFHLQLYAANEWVDLLLLQSKRVHRVPANFTQQEVERR